MDNIYSTPMLVSIVTFSLSTVMSPCPNNIILLSSGLTFRWLIKLPIIQVIMK
ncbi:hypothetical protein [Poseidonibacter ostreae]|uniref:hypothetical protein n=1 Tax=Poseidonibacter ostreae TaxID=2654171 RepID=UPI00186AE119|nr:hypothetical protein [Poseidonibacter ostreae]